MDSQNTFLGEKDFSTSTSKEISFAENKILARKLLLIITRSCDGSFVV